MEDCRQEVIWFHRLGKKNLEIFKILKRFNVSLMFIKRTMDRYKETSLTKDRPRSGHPRTVWTLDAVKAVRERIQRNPWHHLTKMAKGLGMLQPTMSKLIRDDLGMKSY